MYRQNTPARTTLKVNKTYKGETIEARLRRATTMGQPITSNVTSPPIYTAREEGVRPEHDIRTDRFELGVEGTDKIANQKRMKNQEKADARKPKPPTSGTPDATKTGSSTESKA